MQIRFLVMLLTKKQKSHENNTPSPYRGGVIITQTGFSGCYRKNLVLLSRKVAGGDKLLR